MEGEIAHLGTDRPTIQTQYLLKAIDDAGKLFPRATRKAMLGEHPAERHGEDGVWYVASIDVEARIAPWPIAPCCIVAHRTEAA